MLVAEVGKSCRDTKGDDRGEDNGEEDGEESGGDVDRVEYGGDVPYGRGMSFVLSSEVSMSLLW